MKFNKIGIKFINIDVAAEFFIRNLDFLLHSRLKTRTNKRIICLEKNGFILEIFEAKNRPLKNGFLKLLSFEVGDIEKTISFLKNNNVEIIEDATVSCDEAGNKFFYAYFKGPESIKLGLFQKI
jgi:hypothetical protein